MSMILKGRDGNEFELSLTRDSLAEVQDGFGDSGWATITWRAATADDSWEESSPCINRYELVNLAEWLESVGGHEGETSEIEVLAPELRFSLSRQSGDGVTIRIGFHLAERPEEFEVDSGTDAEFIDLTMDRPGVRAAAGALRATLAAAMSEVGKDDLLAEEDSGILGRPDDTLNMVDAIRREPPGAGFGEDNAGNS